MKKNQKHTGHDPIPKPLRDAFSVAISPLILFAARLRINPNVLTAIGFLLGCLAAYWVARGFFRLSGVFILLSGLFDTIDGRLARETNQESRFGALFDSTLDRYGEVIFFIGLTYYFIVHSNVILTVIVAIGLGGSLIVSYVKARAEGLGMECKVGLLQRPERILLLGIGALVHRQALIVALWIIAILSHATTIHRIFHIWKSDRIK
jgi:CDP-diacylglycerol--glycerol-3-phosphate 3-phosphatidyltransferase